MLLFAHDNRSELLCAAKPHIFMNPVVQTEGYVEVSAIDKDGTRYRVLLTREEIRRIVTASVDMAPRGTVWKTVREFHAEDNRNKIRHTPTPV